MVWNGAHVTIVEKKIYLKRKEQVEEKGGGVIRWA